VTRKLSVFLVRFFVRRFTQEHKTKPAREKPSCRAAAACGLLLVGEHSTPEMNCKQPWCALTRRLRHRMLRPMRVSNARAGRFAHAEMLRVLPRRGVALHERAAPCGLLVCGRAKFCRAYRMQHQVKLTSQATRQRGCLISQTASQLACRTPEDTLICDLSLLCRPPARNSRERA
jgi:hypothetical protein